MLIFAVDKAQLFYFPLSLVMLYYESFNQIFIYLPSCLELLFFVTIIYEYVHFSFNLISIVCLSNEILDIRVQNWWNILLLNYSPCLIPSVWGIFVMTCTNTIIMLGTDKNKALCFVVNASPLFSMLNNVYGT